ncbi:MAG: DUF1624 domain-containing protein [Acidobacteria bacterium]|nr:DUF1624 domain-containing protein [Acidobacteriota bacterium]
MNPGARYLSVDALRGLIMMIMAIDHASAFIARQHASEFWAGAMSAYTSAFPFLTRWITHLCAPGFFFLMGAGIYWFAAVRREAGGSEAAAIRRTVGRGFAILVTGQLLESPVMFLQTLLKPARVSLNQISAPLPNDGSALYWGLITLSGLGLAMIVCGLLLRLRPWAWLLVSALCVLATNSLLPASGKPGPWWAAVLLTPGLSQHLLVIYPVIPWLAGAAAGLYFGYWWRGNPVQASRRVWIVGAILLLTGLALRAAGGWGNIRQPRDAGWIEFLNNVKYPPSLVFWTTSLGIALLLLALLIRLPEKVKSEQSPLIVFGQTPLFFYLTHFYLLTICSFVFFREAASLEGAYLVWAAVLVALYPVCAWYRRFKMTRPRESLWRLF